MNPGPLIGIAVALFMILVGNTLEGGHIGSILGGPAAMIVIGGTIGAVIVQFPLSTCGAAVKAAGALFKKPTHDLHKLVDEIVSYADKARRDGVLALEKVATTASDPFLGRALMMAVDGADSATLRDTMEVSMDQENEHGEDAAKVFEAAGGYCPTVGIIGAVLGLIHVMSNLADINAVGSGIAAAFVATIYGVAAANIIFLPFAGRIKMELREHMLAKQLMLAGVLAIQEGTNPKLVRERLNGYLQGHDKGKAGAAGGAKEAAAG
jgi:chemotaxis protein MotA